MQIVGLVISWAVAIGIIGIGIGYAAKSEMNATGFGLPQLPEREARGWWQVKGVRDIVSGILVIVAIITARADLWWLILVLSLIHGDFKVAETVLAKAKDYTRDQWEAALDKAEERAEPDAWPLIMVGDFY